VRLLVDECFPISFVTSLEAAGHDVVWAHMICPGTADITVLQTATADRRLVVTEDRDFGTLIHRDGEPTIGIVSLYARQFPGGITVGASTFAAQITRLGDQLLGRFTVIEPGRLRMHELPKRL
jgi:hypothetical protein